MRRAAALAILLFACGDRKPAAVKPPPAAATQPPAPAPAAAAAPAAPAPASAKPSPPSKEARRAYRKHLAAGRKHASGKEWGEAVTDFEAALAAIPHDPRALSELAWAAFNAGDYDKARRAGRESVAAASEPRVKASSLYNLGRVEEATQHAAQAAKLYRESLALRPNRTVEEHLAGLARDAGEDERATPPLPCPEPRAEDQVCACLARYADDWDKDTPAEDRSCELSDDGTAADFQIVHQHVSRDSESLWLAHRDAAGWSVVADLDDVYNPGAFGISEEWKLVSMKPRALGDHTIVELVSEHDRVDNDAGIAESESEESTLLTVCVLGATVTCPLQMQTRYSYTRERLDLGDDDEEVDAETKKLQTPGLPIHREAELRVDLAPDGTANVVLVKGSADEATRRVLGPHRLW